MSCEILLDLSRCILSKSQLFIIFIYRQLKILIVKVVCLGGVKILMLQVNWSGGSSLQTLYIFNKINIF